MVNHNTPKAEAPADSDISMTSSQVSLSLCFEIAFDNPCQQLDKSAIVQSRTIMDMSIEGGSCNNKK